MRAFVLISLKTPDERAVLDELKAMSKIKEAHVLFGEWDIIAKVEGENPEDVATFVMDEIRALPQVKLTSTLIIAK